MLTIPNLISMIRLLLVPVLLWLLLGADEPAAAGLLLGFIGATDWIDGYLARRLGQVSRVGTMLDPLADRLAVGAALIGGIIADALPRWLGLAVLARELVMAVAALYLWLKERRELAVRFLGKAATLALYFGVSAFFVGEGTGWNLMLTLGWMFGLPGLVLYWVVALQYMGDMRQLLAAG